MEEFFLEGDFSYFRSDFKSLSGLILIFPEKRRDTALCLTCVFRFEFFGFRLFAPVRSFQSGI